MTTMGLGWHGEGDMVGATSFSPVSLVLTLNMGNGVYEIQRTATPEIYADPEYTRREVHLLIDGVLQLLVDDGKI